MCGEKLWADEGALVLWMSWRSLLDRTALAVTETGLMSGTTVPHAAPTEARRKAGHAAAPPLYHGNDQTHGTVIVPVDLIKAEAMMMRTSAVCWRARRGHAEGTEGQPGWTRTVTLPPKAALEGKAATASIAGRQATVRKRMTPYPRTQRGKQSGTAGQVPSQTAIELSSLQLQSDIEHLSLQPRGLSITLAHLLGRPTHFRATERTGTETETW